MFRTLALGWLWSLGLVLWIGLGTSGGFYA